MGTYYNILYNGNLALEQAKQQLQQSYQDNYWEILPVERMEIKDDIALPGSSTSASGFDIAEEKATKAIQKHGMIIKGREANYQMDEAFLLLAKSRYYDQRFIPALDALNYILNRYPTSDKVNHVRLWKQKINIRLDYNETAIERLTKMIEQEDDDLDQEVKADAYAMIAQAYINLENKDSALVSLKRAIPLLKDYEKKGRLLYIKGQLYDRLAKIDSANMAFDEVIALNRKTPRIYQANAYFEKAENFDTTKEDIIAFKELLIELEEDRENRPYLDKIYVEFAEFYKKQDSVNLATTFYNKSLRTNSPDNFLNARSYLTLGDFSFDEAKYPVAGAYYDSTLTKLNENTKLFRRIKRKRENLDDVILYEGIAKEKDSILSLLAMSKEDQRLFFEDYIERLKQAELARLEAEKQEAIAKNLYSKVKNTAGANRGFTGLPGDKTQFYFYNQTVAAYGKQQFFAIWGDIELKDDWRYTSTISVGLSSTAKDIDKSSAVAKNNPLYDPENYISQLPTDQNIIDSIKIDRDFAYYQLGTIYKEKFEEFELSEDKFTALLSNEPEDRLIIPSKYNLYKIYLAQNRLAKAEEIKQNIIQNHPDSRYAAILKNPDGYNQEINSPEAIYTDLYRLFDKQEFEKVIASAEKYITQFSGDPIVPKFELLKATAAGKLYGFNTYKSGINYVALNYPQSPEGKKANELYKENIPVLENSAFVSDTDQRKFHVVYPYDYKNIDQAMDLSQTLALAIEDLNYGDMSVTLDRYNPDEIFVVVHGLNTSLGAQGFAELLAERRDYKIKRPFFVISSANYKIVEIHKNVDIYKSKKGRGEFLVEEKSKP
ncbi:hypothetical protein GCM10009117_19310 [Gangjinia marincola]|uniref:Protein involved in gliding motility SprE n=1 Tax=Gangjinia marincola TaxID=578463 RepID=A0ABN1MIQ2_9FLAO